MRRPVRLMALAVVVLTGMAAGGARQSGLETVTVTGWARIATASDHRTSVVTIAVAGSPQHPDELVVSRAFRLQHSTPQFFEYEGPATVAFDGDHLLVEASADVGWVFVIAGRTIYGLPRNLAYRVFEVSGASQYWGPSTQLIADVVLTRLLAGESTATDGGPTCDECAYGGPGESQCSAECGDYQCSAHCGAGSYACCSCPGRCGCCPNIQGRRPSGTPTPGPATLKK